MLNLVMVLLPELVLLLEVVLVLLSPTNEAKISVTNKLYLIYLGN